MKTSLTILIVTISLIAGFIYGCCENTSGTVVLKSGEVLEATRIYTRNDGIYHVTHQNRFGDYETTQIKTLDIAEIKYNKDKNDSTITNSNPTKFEDYGKWD